MEINELLNLKTDKEKIIEYLKFKENLTFEQTGIRSFIPADFDEMENWNKEDFTSIIEKDFTLSVLKDMLFYLTFTGEVSYTIRKIKLDKKEA